MICTAPARYVLTVLHRQDPDIPPVKGPEPSDGATVCGQAMLVAETWLPVERQPGDALCPGCWPGETPAATEDAPAEVQESLL